MDTMGRITLFRAAILSISSSLDKLPGQIKTIEKSLYFINRSKSQSQTDEKKTRLEHDQIKF